MRHGLKTALSGMAAHYSFVESDDVKEKPSEPIQWPEQKSLTHQYLIQQTCGLSVEHASQVQTQVVHAAQDYAKDYISVLKDMINLYQDSVIALTDEGNQRLVSLKEKAKSLQKAVRDVEMMGHFVKKLMHANAEMCFLAGAEFVSIQASERSVQGENVIQGLLEEVKLLELDVAKAQAGHIEKSGRILEQINKENETKTDDKSE